MRNAEYLLCSAKHSELFRHALRRDAGYAGVDLVKDQRVHAVLLRKNVFQSEHDARKLAAGRNAADRSERLTGVCRHGKAHIVDTGGCKSVFTAALREQDLKSDRRHTEIAKLAANACFKLFCGLFSARRKQRRLFDAVILML